MTVPQIRLMRTPEADPSIALPAYETQGSAGADIRANLLLADRSDGVTLPPLGRALVPTGLRAAISEGYEIQIRPRSGLALKQGISLANTPGTIDSDYRGEIGVILINLSDRPVAIRHGDRIAQIIVAPVLQASFVQVGALDKTARGTGGFGSTGTG